MKLKQAAVGTVLERRNHHGCLQIVKVTHHSDGGGETWYRPYGVELEGDAMFLDVERDDDWTETQLCESCGQPMRLHEQHVRPLSELDYGSRLAFARDRAARVAAGCER